MRKTLVIAALLASAAAPLHAADAPYPTRPVRMIVPFAPGGPTDVIARVVAQKLSEAWSHQVVVDNRAGAGGNIGAEAVARAAPDGYTLGIMTAGQIIAATMNKSLRYDTLMAFDPIAQVATAGLLMVTRPDFPSNNVKDLVGAAKASPGKIVFASPGFGATQHMAAELFKQHVPFRTSPEAITAVLGKQVDVLFDTVSAVLGQVQSGQLKALAVTGKDRFPAVPTVPAAVESGVVPGYDVTTWYGFFAPRGTPPAIIAKLNKAVSESLQEPGVRDKLIKAGVVVKGSTPDAFGTFMADELARWDKVRTTAGIEKQ